MLVMKNPLLCMSSHVHTQTHLTTLSPHPHARTVLGMGFVWGILFFGNHVIMEWLWMMARLVESDHYALVKWVSEDNLQKRDDKGNTEA